MFDHNDSGHRQWEGLIRLNTLRIHGRDLAPGTEVSISSERGRFRFLGISTTSTGRLVCDFIGGAPGHECWRSFYPERIKTVHRINRTRHNADSTPKPAAARDARRHGPRTAQAAAELIVRQLETYTYRWCDERSLQQGIGAVLAERFMVAAELAVSARDRPDFLVHVEPYRVAVEVKISGARTAILRQLGRYAAHDNIDAVVLASGQRALLVGIPQMIHRKPVVAAHAKARLR